MVFTNYIRYVRKVYTSMSVLGCFRRYKRTVKYNYVFSKVPVSKKQRQS